MEKYLLLKAHKRRILECVRHAGLNPLNFEWGDENTQVIGETYVVSNFKYTNTEFYFIFDRTIQGKFICRFYPGYRGLTQTLDIGFEWDDALNYFNQWVQYLKEEVKPDPWDQVRQRKIKKYMMYWKYIGIKYKFHIGTLIVIIGAGLSAYKFKLEPKLATVFFERFLSLLLVSIMMLIIVTYTIIFFVQKGKRPEKGVVEFFCLKGSRVFFIATACILLFDAGLKISTQLNPAYLLVGVDPIYVIDILILSIVAVMLITLHEVFKLIILSIKEESEKVKDLERKSSTLLFVVLFGMTVLIAGLCIVKHIIR